MSTNQHPVVLPAEVLEGPDEEVVDANIDVVNAMYSELLGEDEIAVNALRSYYVDFYFTESLDGGFAQYAVSAVDREEIDAFVRDGLRGMGASKHLELFEATVAAYDGLNDDEILQYLTGDGELTDAVAAVEQLDERFEQLLENEDVVALNAAWLRGQEGLLALDDDGIEDEIARRVGLIPDLEERRAEAAVLEEGLDDDGFDDPYDQDDVDFDDFDEPGDDPEESGASHAHNPEGAHEGAPRHVN